MSLSTIFSVSFSVLLKRIDGDLAALAREERCAYCGGALHTARFPRTLRGVPEAVAGVFTRRESLCCARKGCRRRRTPPSVVFQGRRLYFASSMMLASAFASGSRIHRAPRLQAIFGVDRGRCGAGRSGGARPSRRTSCSAPPRVGSPRRCRPPICRDRCSSAFSARPRRGSSRCCCSSPPRPAARCLSSGLSDGRRKSAEHAS